MNALRGKGSEGWGAQSIIEWSLIALGFLVVLATLNPNVGGDGAVRFTSVQGFLQGDERFSKFSLVQPLLSMPLAWLAVALHVEPSRFVAYFNFLIFILFAIPIYRQIMRRYGAGTGRAWLLLMLCGSMFPHHLQNYYGEVLSALCLFLGVLWVERRPLASMVLMAVGCVNTPALLPPFLAFALVWFVLDKKKIPCASAALAIAAVAFELWVKHAGAAGGYFSDSEHGFQTVLPYSGRSGFSYPVLFGLISIFLSFGKGLVFYIPGVFLAMSKRVRSTLQLDARASLIALVALAGPVLLYSKWWAWYGGSFWGPRFFLYLCAPACLIMARLVQEKGLSLPRLSLLWLVVLLSVWVSVDGYVFAQSDMDACWGENYAKEYLCWYIPEFSALWRPFVTGRFWDFFEQARAIYGAWSLLALCYLSGLMLWNNPHRLQLPKRLAR
ncbi:hypothetical protein QE400_001257 [Xanthomonas sacchari]|uniref:hypothetical protein n=1 Tax=Xanthomonas sacchari TaxID=56458 RepID=UPI002789D539|nr:hypothetical protein [Xanthomonas sacchari]MDQ1091844.1 hypothetical protein [Xanthomonas sacchari]